MLSNILNLEGVAVLDKKQQKSINGGTFAPTLSQETLCTTWSIAEAQTQEIQSGGQFSSGHMMDIAQEAYEYCMLDPSVMN